LPQLHQACLATLYHQPKQATYLKHPTAKNRGMADYSELGRRGGSSAIRSLRHRRQDYSAKADLFLGRQVEDSLVPHSPKLLAYLALRTLEGTQDLEVLALEQPVDFSAVLNRQCSQPICSTPPLLQPRPDSALQHKLDLAIQYKLGLALEQQELGHLAPPSQTASTPTPTPTEIRQEVGFSEDFNSHRMNLSHLSSLALHRARRRLSLRLSARQTQPQHKDRPYSPASEALLNRRPNLLYHRSRHL